MRLRHLAPLAAAILAAPGCGSKHPELQHCATPDDCAADAFCREGRCSASAPPIAVVTAPAERPLRSHTVLRFDGSLSHDPDPEDRVAAFAWSFRRVVAGCDPYPPAATGQAADVVFGCAGAFEVVLAVTDATGHAGAPAVLPVTVELSADVPTVTMGADLSEDHRCQGVPLRCGADRPVAAPLALSASAASPVSDLFRYAWSYELPPELAGQPAPRVTIDPPDGPSPSVIIETDGTAISGTYVFTVTATDAYQLVAVGRQRVTLQNRPPVVDGAGAVQVPHVYDAAGGRFLASADLPPFTVTDPDGDPLTSLGFTSAHAGDGPGTFDLTATEWAASIAISVPYAVPSDALHLIGGPGLSRTVGFAAVDPNGGRTDATWDVLVANRRPRLTGPLGPVTVDHGFDAGAANYVALAPLAGIVDDDGDPILQSAPTGSPLCPTLEVLGGTLAARCAVSYAGPGSLAPLLATHPVAVQVSDPWSTLVAGSASVTVLNRAPVVPPQQIAVPTTCTTDTRVCCEWDVDLHLCLGWSSSSQGRPVLTPPAAADPDGDPLELTYSTTDCVLMPTSVSCPSAGCPEVPASTCSAAMICGPLPAVTLAVSASDGLESASATMILAPECP